MLAIVALICFIIALIEESLGPISMVVLGLAFLAAHFAFGDPIAGRIRRRRR